MYKHRFSRPILGGFLTCEKCQHTLFEIRLTIKTDQEFINKNKFLNITDDDINFYFPCISDNDAVIKNIIE